MKDKSKKRSCQPWEREERWNPALGVWMPQKIVMVGNRHLPLFREGRPVFALPGGGEYVGEVREDAV